jgi:hypothetical protein
LCLDTPGLAFNDSPTCFTEKTVKRRKTIKDIGEMTT